MRTYPFVNMTRIRPAAGAIDTCVAICAASDFSYSAYAFS
jgi:hypothetical protein